MAKRRKQLTLFQEKKTVGKKPAKKLVQEKNQILTIRSKPAESRMIESLKIQLHEKTSAGALLEAGKQYLIQIEQLGELKKIVADLRQQKTRAEGILLVFKGAFAELDKFSSGDRSEFDYQDNEDSDYDED